MSVQSFARDSEELRFGPLQESDLQGISDLITRMSDDKGLRLRDKSAGYYRWMYLENPAGPAVVHSARLGERVVASFALAPKRFQVDGRQLVIGKTMDMFTDPEFQGRGLIKRCTTAVFEGAKAAGIAGWCVTPSVNSYPIFKDKWGYREDLRILFRARVLKFGPLLGAVLKPAGLLGRVVDGVRALLPHRDPGLPDGYQVDHLERFDHEADRLWGEVGPGYKVALVRDAAYLNWRYVENPDDYTMLGLRRDGLLVGIVVLAETVRRGVRCGEIVDFVAPAEDDEVLKLLVQVAVEHSRRAGHALVQAWTVKDTTLDARFRVAGLGVKRTEIKFLTSPDLPDPLLRDPNAWLLTQGDGNDV